MIENKGKLDKALEENFLADNSKKTEYTLKTGKLGEKVVNAYKKIEDTAVSSYQKIEDTVVDNYKKIENKFVETFLEKNK